jgi:hypothetical protein
MMQPAGFLLLALVAPTVLAELAVSVDADGFVAFEQIDSDHNGYVSHVEARSVAAVETRFYSADTNGDGLLDQSEYTSVRMAREAN